MEIIARFLDRAKQKNARVVLPDGEDERVLHAARRLLDEHIARPIVLGHAGRMAEAAAKADLPLDGLSAIDPAVSPQVEAYASAYARHRNVEDNVAHRLVRKPLVYGGMMLAQGDADAMVAGALKATATVIQAAAVTVGYVPGIQTASSFFLMVLPSYGGKTHVPLIYADCAVNVQPTPEQLADIALATEATAARLLDEPPRVALLSFSTTGSGVHADAEKVRRALALIRQRRPDARIDGEFQADTALCAGRRQEAETFQRRSRRRQRADLSRSGRGQYRLQVDSVSGRRESHRSNPPGIRQAGQRLVPRRQRRRHRGRRRHLLGSSAD